ncbi:lipoprotein [Enterococcus rotai]|uniref:lipoprotein n=1 Tax=Enterococcus rotai TaxID=118060 RepID=UPI0032B51612
MKKIILLLSGLIILTACQDNKSSTDATWDSLVKKYQDPVKNAGEEERKTVHLKEYNFFIPTIYDTEYVEDSKNIEKNLFNNKEIEVYDLPVSPILFGGKYDKNSKMLILSMYLVNNTEQEIKDVSFTYGVDLTALKGKTKGEFDYRYSRVNHEIIPPKSIVPIFLGIQDVDLGTKKDFYRAEDLKTIDAKDIIVYYNDNIEESN